MRKFLRGENGSSLMLLVLIMGIFVGIAAMVTISGSLYLTKSNLQNAVDAAALAGAQSLKDDATGAAAIKAATDALEKNGVSSSEIVDNSPSDYNDDVEDEHDMFTKMTVSVRRTMPYGLSQLLGGQAGSKNVEAIAAAKIFPVQDLKGAAPIVCFASQLKYNEEGWILKGGAQNKFHWMDGADGDEAKETGWRGWLDLAPSLADAIRYGTTDTLEIGAEPLYEDGNVNSGPIRDAVKSRIGDTIIVPIVKTGWAPCKDKECALNDEGHGLGYVEAAIVNDKKKVEIIGFAGFKITGEMEDGDLYGEFVEVLNVQSVKPPSTGIGYTGVYGISLVQ